MQTLAEYSHQPAAEAVRMLLLTGARLGEVLGARFEQFEGDVWVKPPSSTKQKREHRAPLNAPARQLLDRLRRKSSSPWLFPGRGDGHVVDLKSHWPRICRAANIHGLRIHDLRHSYASQLASAGVGLHVIGGLLGHSSPATTYRYAHLFDDPLRQATEKVGAVIIGKPAAKILPIKGGRRQQ
jgi:integrase